MVALPQLALVLGLWGYTIMPASHMFPLLMPGLRILTPSCEYVILFPVEEVSDPWNTV